MATWRVTAAEGSSSMLTSIGTSTEPSRRTARTASDAAARTGVGQGRSNQLDVWRGAGLAEARNSTRICGHRRLHQCAVAPCRVNPDTSDSGLSDFANDRIAIGQRCFSNVGRAGSRQCGDRRGSHCGCTTGCQRPDVIDRSCSDRRADGRICALHADDEVAIVLRGVQQVAQSQSLIAKCDRVTDAPQSPVPRGKKLTQLVVVQ